MLRSNAVLASTLRRAILKRTKVPLLLVTNLVNIRYVTGLAMSAGTLLLRRKKATLYVDGRYLEKAKRDCARGIRVKDVDSITADLKEVRHCGFESHDVTVARLKRWKRQFPRTMFLPTEGGVEHFRRTKSPAELRAIRRVCRITDRILTAVPRILRVGSREKDVSWEIEKYARQLGADGMAFETIVAFGRNSSLPHHRAGPTKLRKGDIVQIDMGVKVRGYCSDCSRVFFTKPPTEEQKRIYGLLCNIVKECTSSAKAGMTNRTLDKRARVMLRSEASRSIRPKAATTLDHLFLHSLGHGIGLEIHEGVNLSAKAKKVTKLLPNEVITIEPGVYFAGRWGMRIEDTVVVTRKKGRRLTHADLA